MVRPGQTRKLPTRLVSLSEPPAGSGVVMPQEGEVLKLRDIDAIEGVSPQASRRRQEAGGGEAPETVSQLVLWHLGYGIDWPTLESLSQGWANRSELALAKQFVDGRAGTEAAGRVREPGTIFYEVSAGPGQERLAAEVAPAPRRPVAPGSDGPAGESRPGLRAPRWPAGSQIADGAASVRVSSSNEAGASWVDVAKFSLPAPEPGASPPTPAEVIDRVAEGVPGPAHPGAA